MVVGFYFRINLRSSNVIEKCVVSCGKTTSLSILYLVTFAIVNLICNILSDTVSGRFEPWSLADAG